MVTRTGQSSLSSAIFGTYNIPSDIYNQNQIGIVIASITTPNTPTQELYNKDEIGTIFYVPYNDVNKNKSIKDFNLKNDCISARPLFSFLQDYPLPGEQVLLFNAASPDTQNAPTAIQTYYLPSINLWNNTQQNSLLNDKWKTFIQNEDIRNLLAFEGDRIYQGRKGNGIRFGTTVKYHSDLNEWSSVGNDGDPITIITNGYITPDTGSSSPNVEEINKEMSSIYMTSTQKIPLIPGASIINKYLFFNITSPKNYTNSQIILNSDRVTLNSKRDEVLLFAKTNIELNTDNITNLNSGQRVHINSPVIWLGSNLITGQQPTEPLLLGLKTQDLLTGLINALSELGNSLVSVSTPPPGSALVGVNTAGETLVKKLKPLQEKLKDITSKNNFTI
jgi:hypothetical protein